MKRFAKLFSELDTSTSTRAKVDALKRYFALADAADAAWAVYFFAGGKPRQAINSRVLREFAISATGLPEWLFEESYQAVGDLAETIALLLPPPLRTRDATLAHWIEQRLLPLRGRTPAEVLAELRTYVEELETPERFLLIKLIGGGFRVGVSRLLVTRALAEHSGLDAKLIAQRMIGYTDPGLKPAGAGSWMPNAARYLSLISAGDHTIADGHPYPFFLAHALTSPLERFADQLGAPADWLIEWKYDGIRAQLVKRAGKVWLWSRGEELMTERFPEIAERAQSLPDGTVLDGEILVWRDGPQPFALLQKRVTRKTVTASVQQQAPALFLAYDILEANGVDLRLHPQSYRRESLEQLAGAHAIAISPRVEGGSWESLALLREQSRARGVEGLMLKHKDSTYRIGRTKDLQRANWWKWKIDPYSIDAVLVYAQRGHGRRASLYSDYTFAVWTAEAESTGRTLVPFTKAYSGLTDVEIRQVDAAIRRTTLEKFGPVRSVTPTMVFEIGFEGIQRSPRHKSGIAVRFPRMLRWRREKPIEEADTLTALQSLLGGAGGEPA